MTSRTATRTGSDWHEPRQLQGFGLTLTPLAVSDAAEFLAALGSAEESAQVLQHLSYGPPADLQSATKIIAAAVADHERVPFAQRLTETGELVGTTSYYDIDQSLRTLAIGHTWVARPYWQTFVNTAAKLIMMGHAFDDLGAERLVWHTDIRNTRSQAAIARLGAVREGVLRHHRIRRDGSWRDTVQFSMLSQEWPAARRRLESRLEYVSDEGD
jgi:RimJ/RimL family protein N-acetyltransferase